MNKINFLFFVIIGLSFTYSCNRQGANTENLTKDTVNMHGNGKPARVKFYNGEIKKENLVRIEAYYVTGKKHYTKKFINGEENGLWYSWYKDGSTWSEAKYKDGKRNGESKIFFNSGGPKITGQYIDGKKEGVWYFYNEVGDTIKEITYKDGIKKDMVDYKKGKQK